MPMNRTVMMSTDMKVMSATCQRLRVNNCYMYMQFNCSCLCVCDRDKRVACASVSLLASPSACTEVARWVRVHVYSVSDVEA